MRRKKLLPRKYPYVPLLLAFFAAMGLSVLVMPFHTVAHSTPQKALPAATPASRMANLPQAAAIAVQVPRQGQTVGRDFTIHGNASTYDGIVAWELRYANRAVDSGRTFSDPSAAGQFAISIHAPSHGEYYVALFEAKGQQGSYVQLTLRQVKVR